MATKRTPQKQAKRTNQRKDAGKSSVVRKAIKGGQKLPDIDKEWKSEQYGPPMRQGRISKLERIPQDKYQTMIELIKGGTTWGVAAAFIGIHPRTFNIWMTRGMNQYNKVEPRKGKYVRLYHDVIQAGANARLGAEVRVHTKDPVIWLNQSPAARAIPDVEKWADKTVVQIQGDSENPIDVNVAQVLPIDQKTAAEMLKIMAEIGLINITEQGRMALFSDQPQDVVDSDFDDDNDEPTNGQLPTNGKEKHNGKG